jgi:hypothetical protein
MLTHVLVSVGHTVGHLVCNGGAGYLRKVPALFKVKVKPFSSCTLYCLMLVCFGYWFTSTYLTFKLLGVPPINTSPKDYICETSWLEINLVGNLALCKRLDCNMSCRSLDCQLKLVTLLHDLYPIFKRIDGLHHPKSLLLIMRELHIILKHFEWLGDC